MRLFIASKAILFESIDIRKAFDSLLRGTWVEAQNLHLTWVFLGDTMSPETAIATMQKISLQLDRPIPVKGLGTFGKPPQILYGVSDHKRLYEQAERFAEAGFEMHRFKPHVTLCRIKSVADRKGFDNTVHTFQELTLGEILPEITLYRSHLSKEGPRYEALYTLKP